LQFADFSSNEFDGPLPTSIFEIPAIEILYFDNNNITGPVPPNYGSASLLRDLYINSNMIDGMVPQIEPGQLENLVGTFIAQNAREIMCVEDSRSFIILF